VDVRVCGLPESVYEKQVFLARLNFFDPYPFDGHRSYSIEFISVVDHPLLQAVEGGHIVGPLNLVIDATPALTARTVLLSVQEIILNPMAYAISHRGCMQNPNWHADLAAHTNDMATPPQHRAELFRLLMEAVYERQYKPEAILADWRGAPFIRALRIFCHSIAKVKVTFGGVRRAAVGSHSVGGSAGYAERREKRGWIGWVCQFPPGQRHLGMSGPRSFGVVRPSASWLSGGQVWAG